MKKNISATREGEQIVIEIKSFLGRSPMGEFETALGQYLIYKTFLSVTDPDYKVHLAIGQKFMKSFLPKVLPKVLFK